MNERELHPALRKHSLERLLDSLLRMERDDHIRNRVQRNHRLHGHQILRCPAQQLLSRAHWPSGRQLSPLGQRGTDETAAYVTPLSRVPLAHHHHISRKQKPPKRPAQPDRLPHRIIDTRLDYQEVQVAVRTSLTSRVGPEQDHSRVRWRNSHQPTTGLGNESIVDLGQRDYQSGSDGTRTRDLRRDRPAL